MNRPGQRTEQRGFDWPWMIAGLVLAALLASGRPVAATTIEHWTTEQGLDVYFVRSDSVPLLDVLLDFDAGSARDGETPGLARMLSRLIGEGAGDLDADAISRRFDDVAARFRASSGRDRASVQLRSLVDPELLNGAIDTLSLAVGQPSVSEDALERIRNGLMAALQRSAMDPGSVAQRSLWAALYPGHPYGNPPEGTRESVAELSRDELIAFHQRYYTPANATLTLVGAIDQAKAMAIAERIAAALPAGLAPSPIPAPEDPVQDQTIEINMPGSQTVVLKGTRGYARGDHRHHALSLVNHLLGGSGLGSRLLRALREERGLSYGASSGFFPMRQPGPFSVQTQVRNDRVEEALAVIDQALKSLLSTDPDLEEFDDAVRNLTGGFPLAMDSNAGLASLVSQIAFYDLPLDYLDQYLAIMESMPIDTAMTTWRAWAEHAPMVTVLVGPDVARPEPRQSEESMP